MKSFQFQLFALLIFGGLLQADTQVERVRETIQELVSEGNLQKSHQKGLNLDLIHSKILDLKRIGTPEAASALMSIVLDPAVAEYDKVRWMDPLRINAETVLGNTYQGVAVFAGCELAKLPLVEIPDALEVTRVKEEPHRSRYIGGHAADSPVQFLADCRAWCEEVRDGKRTMKFAGDSRKYDFQGKSVTSRSSSRRGDRGKFQEGNPPLEFDADEGEKVSLWIYLISGAVLIGSFGYWWLGRRNSMRP